MSFEGMTEAEIHAYMNRAYAENTAYPLVHQFDIERMNRLNAVVSNWVEYSLPDGEMLEVCCGQGGTAAYLPPTARFTGLELSEVAVAQAQAAFPQFTFIQGDAQALPFEDKSFDIVIAKEAIEHLPSQKKALDEWYRVLRPGGELLLTTPNRDSLHLRINRKLGNPDFLCCDHHVRELAYDEMVLMLCAAGFQILQHKAVGLAPYWGIPGIDNPQLRRLTDNDPEVVRWLSEIGQSAPTEYGFCMAFRARR